MNIRTGLRISPGLGYVKSQSLDGYFTSLGQQPQMDGQTSYDADFRMRSHFNFGGFFEYKISENFFASAEPSFVYSNNKILLNYYRDNVDAAGNGTTERIFSDATIKINYISLPLTGKFRFLHRKELSVFAGLNLNLYFTPKILSDEESVITQYSEGIILASNINRVSAKAKADGFRVFGAQFTFGFSKVLNPYGRNLLLDIRYSHPLTSSPLYTSASGFQEDTYFNSLYSKDVQDQIRTDQPQFNFRDFKVGVVNVSFCYTIYKNYR